MAPAPMMSIHPNRRSALSCSQDRMGESPQLEQGTMGRDWLVQTNLVGQEFRPKFPETGAASSARRYEVACELYFLRGLMLLLLFRRQREPGARSQLILMPRS